MKRQNYYKADKNHSFFNGYQGRYHNRKCQIPSGGQLDNMDNLGGGVGWETSQNANVKLTCSNIHQQKMSFLRNDFMLLRINSICSPDLNIRMLAIIVLFLQHMEFFFVLFNFVFIVHVHFYSQTCSWCISYANNLQAAKMSVTSKLE